MSDLDYEKAGVQHIDHQNTILEEDEGANVGMAAYHESQKMAAIVRLPPSCAVPLCSRQALTLSSPSALFFFQTPEQNKTILRRIDWFLLPLFLMTQTLQYLDKTALNYASVFGMNKALGLVGNQYSLAASMFYIGYMVAQPFFSYFLGRFPAGKVLGISCVFWGVSVLTIVANRNFAQIMVNVRRPSMPACLRALVLTLSSRSLPFSASSSVSLRPLSPPVSRS